MLTSGTVTSDGLMGRTTLRALRVSISTAANHQMKQLMRAEHSQNAVSKEQFWQLNCCSYFDTYIYIYTHIQG